jgi:hypothetical protein
LKEVLSPVTIQISDSYVTTGAVFSRDFAISMQHNHETGEIQFLPSLEEESLPIDEK